MKTKSIFTRPKNEATVKLYTDVSEKKVWVSNPNFFTQELRSGKTLPDIGQKNYLTQFNLHSLKMVVRRTLQTFNPSLT